MIIHLLCLKHILSRLVTGMLLIDMSLYSTLHSAVIGRMEVNVVC